MRFMMMPAHSKHPYVSVVVLTYNGAWNIEALLKSIYAQSYPQDRMEVIVTDNCSSDNTIEIVRTRYPQVKTIVLTSNVGFSAGNNLALKEVSHELVAFLNQDTICHVNWLRELVNEIDGDSDMAACSSNVIPASANQLVMSSRDLQVDTIYYCDLSVFGYGSFHRIIGKEKIFPKILSGCAFIIRKEVIHKLGYFFDDTMWMYNEDTDLSLRIRNLGYRICVLRDSIVYHHHHRDAWVGKKRLSLLSKAIQNRVYAFYKNMEDLEFLLFFPLLLFGGAFKVFEMPLKMYQKSFLFVPFGLFSVGCMLRSLFQLSSFSRKRQEILRTRQLQRFSMLWDICR